MIAFDRHFAGDSTLYILPPSGGIRKPVVTDAMDVDWSPSARRLAFVRPSDGSIHTIGLDGAGETIVAPAGTESACMPIGCGLAWSPDGQFIAYSDLSNIWTVHVTPDGQPLGPPTLISAGGQFYQTQLTWSDDSKTIVFNSNRANDGGAALWSVPADGGVAEELTGTTSLFNFDPNIARGGGEIVYAGSTG